MIKIFDEKDTANVFDRPLCDTSEYEKTVSQIIDKVIKEKDKALFEFAEKFDNVKLDTLEVTAEEMDEAEKLVDTKLKKTIKQAAENIAEFHSRQLEKGFEIKKENGIVLGQKVTPLDRVGIYVPGGTACYPSTVLMNAVPAKIAGVGEIIMVTPPDKTGGIKKEVLAAAAIAGVTRVFKIGGAGAIAALAFGTESVPRVDKITGPGNIYVALAKKLVFGAVGVDMIAGPSEILIVADNTADADTVAADMLSQAEHDRLASAVLVTDDRALADAVADSI